MNWEMQLKEYANAFIENGFQIVLILLLGFIALKLVNLMTQNIVKVILHAIDDSEDEKKVKTIRQTLKSILDIIIIFVCSIMVIQKLGIDVGPILAAAGVVGIAVGFGSQRLVEDIITGVTILATNQIRVGDIVKIGDKSGLVEKVDIRMVVLRDVSGSVHFIRTGKIDTVTNMTKDYSYYLINVGISYKENVEKVIAILKDVYERIKDNPAIVDDILEPIEVLGIDKFEESAVILRARIKTKPIKQWDIGYIFNLEMKKAFDEAGIEIPYPHRTIHITNSADSLK